MVYKSGQIFLPFCQGSRVWQTDGRILIAIPRLHYMQRGKNVRERLAKLHTSQCKVKHINVMKTRFATRKHNIIDRRPCIINWSQTGWIIISIVGGSSRRAQFQFHNYPQQLPWWLEQRGSCHDGVVVAAAAVVVVVVVVVV